MKKVLCFVFILLLLSGCRPEEIKEKKVLPPLVSVGFPSENIFEEKIFSIGTLEAGNELELIPEVSGTIRNMYVKEGQNIKKGQKLFKFDTFTETESLKALESQLKTDMENNKLKFDDAKKVYENNLNLFESGAISTKDLDDSLNDYKQKEKIYDNSKVNYDKQVSVKERQLRDRVVYSPMSGKISEIYIKVNQYVSASPVLKISDDNSVHIESQITVEDARKVSIGDSVKIYVGGQEDIALDGDIKFIDDNVNKKGLVDIEVNIIEYLEKLYEGQYTELEIIVDKRSGIEVPRSSLIKSENNNYVYKYSDGKVSLVKVEIGLSSDNNIEILSGISIDEEIVTSGMDKLKDDIEVRVE
jgi:RND family efflux transporter MFP subunit